MVYEDSIFEFISTIGRLYILTQDGPQRFEHYHELIEKLVFLTNFLRSTSKRDETIHVINILNEWKHDFHTYFAGSTYEYEYIAAQRFLDGTLDFDDFVTDRYRLLIAREQEIIKKHLPAAPKKYLFVGGGPFPVSAVLMAMAMKHITIYLLDKSPQACEVATKVIQKMHLQSNIIVLPPTTVESYEDINDYDIIHIASMVGLNEEEKTNILRSIANRLKSHKFILGRCSVPHSLSALLYSGFSHEAVKELYHLKDIQEHQQPVIVSNILIERI